MREFVEFGIVVEVDEEGDTMPFIGRLVDRTKQIGLEVVVYVALRRKVFGEDSHL